MYERDLPNLKDLFNKSLLDLIAKVSMANTTNEQIIKNKENFFYLIKQTIHIKRPLVLFLLMLKCNCIEVNYWSKFK